MKIHFYIILLIVFKINQLKAQNDELPDCQMGCMITSYQEDIEKRLNDSLGLVLANKALKNIPENYTFVKSFRTKRIRCTATKHFAIFSEGSTYRVDLETAENTIIKISIYTLVNKKKELLVNNFVNNQYQRFITYRCPKTWAYYIHFQVIKATDNIEASGGAVLSYLYDPNYKPFKNIKPIIITPRLFENNQFLNKNRLNLSIKRK